MTRAKSVPAKTAEKIEQLGWEVERMLWDSKRRGLICRRRGSEDVTLNWKRNAQGRDIFEPDESTYFSVAEALKAMSLLDGKALQALDDETLIAAVAGKTVRWRSSVTNKFIEDVVSFQRVFVERRSDLPLNDTINFVGSRGFRSIRLSAIERVA